MPNKVNIQGFPLHSTDADITYYLNFINSVEASTIFKTLKLETPWQQDHIKVFGKGYT